MYINIQINYIIESGLILNGDYKFRTVIYYNITNL